jgi:hypothetical protein
MNIDDLRLVQGGHEPSADLPDVLEILHQAEMPDPFRQLIAYGGRNLTPYRYFCDFQETTGQLWFTPDLWKFRQYLAATHPSYRNTTLDIYVSIIRRAYEDLMKSHKFCDKLLSLLPPALAYEHRLALLLCFFEQLDRKLEAFRPPPRKLRTDIQPRQWSTQTLTRNQIDKLLALQPSTLMGLRDRAIIALLATTGIHPTELVELLRRDFFGGGIFVRCAKILPWYIPFEPLVWSVPLVTTWIRASGIQEGPLFVQLTEKSVFVTDAYGRPKPLCSEQVSQITRRYPLWRDGREFHVKPRHLTSAYTHSLYALGVPFKAIMAYRGIITCLSDAT